MPRLLPNLDLTAKPVRSADPTFEPVSLADVKKAVELPLEYTHHDEMLLGLIQFAREQVEHDTGIVCATGTYTWKLSQFPDYRIGEYGYQSKVLPQSHIVIPIRPVTAISSIVYVDDSGNNQTWSSANYTLKNDTVQPVVYLGYDKTWPTHRGYVNDITITMTAGYATQLAVPRLIKQMCTLVVAREFRDREGLEAGEQELSAYARSYEMLVRRLQRSNYP